MTRDSQRRLPSDQRPPSKGEVTITLVDKIFDYMRGSWSRTLQLLAVVSITVLVAAAAIGIIVLSFLGDRHMLSRLYDPPVLLGGLATAVVSAVGTIGKRILHRRRARKRSSLPESSELARQGSDDGSGDVSAGQR